MTTSAADPLLNVQADAETTGLKALASSTFTSSPSSTKVALIVLPDVSDDDVTTTYSTLAGAGASVVGRVMLTDNRQSTSMGQYRTTLSTTLVLHLASGTVRIANTNGVVDYSIVQVLTMTGAEASLLRQILTDESMPIMTVDGNANGSVTTLVTVSPYVQATAASNATPAAATSNPDTWAGLGQVLGPASGVLVDDAFTCAVITSRMRVSGAVATTVDSVGMTLVAADTVLALSTPVTSARAFDVDASAQSMIPSVRQHTALLAETPVVHYDRRGPVVFLLV